MNTNILSKHAKKFAIIASILMLTMIAVPMVAAETNYEYYCDEAQSSTTDITLYDLCGAEIEIIDGMPYIVAEVEDECINIPLPLSDNLEMMVDGVPKTIEVDGNYLLLPTEEGIERICISEFDVNVVDGDLMMVHEVNPIFSKIIAAAIVTYKLAKAGCITAKNAWNALPSEFRRRMINILDGVIVITIYEFTIGRD